MYLLDLVKISEPTLLYFFSTIAQAFAALAAFILTASHARISWVDEKITSNKKAILYTFNGTNHYTVNRVDFEMCKLNATEVVKKGRENSDTKELAEKLALYIDQMQDLRSGIRNFVIVGMTMTAIGIIGILFSKPISEKPEYVMTVIYLFLPAISISLFFMGKFIYQSLAVSLKMNI